MNGAGDSPWKRDVKIAAVWRLVAMASPLLVLSFAIALVSGLRGLTGNELLLVLGDAFAIVSLTTLGCTLVLGRLVTTRAAGRSRPPLAFAAVAALPWFVGAGLMLSALSRIQRTVEEASPGHDTILDIGGTYESTMVWAAGEMATAPLFAGVALSLALGGPARFAPTDHPRDEGAARRIAQLIFASFAFFFAVDGYCQWRLMYSVHALLSEDLALATPDILLQAAASAAGIARVLPWLAGALGGVTLALLARERRRADQGRHLVGPLLWTVVAGVLLFSAQGLARSSLRAGVVARAAERSASLNGFEPVVLSPLEPIESRLSITAPDLLVGPRAVRERAGGEALDSPEALSGALKEILRLHRLRHGDDGERGPGALPGGPCGEDAECGPGRRGPPEALTCVLGTGRPPLQLLLDGRTPASRLREVARLAVDAGFGELVLLSAHHAPGTYAALHEEHPVAALFLAQLHDEISVGLAGECGPAEDYQYTSFTIGAEGIGEVGDGEVRVITAPDLRAHLQSAPGRPIFLALTDESTGGALASSLVQLRDASSDPRGVALFGSSTDIARLMPVVVTEPPSALTAPADTTAAPPAPRDDSDEHAEDGSRAIASGRPYQWNRRARPARPRLHAVVEVGEVSVRTNGAEARDEVTSDWSRATRALARHHRADLRGCYQPELDVRPDLEGGVDIRVLVDDAGGVIQTVVPSSTLRNQPTEACLSRSLRSWQFPSPPGESVVVLDVHFTLHSRN